jgi:phage replication initiation protein
MSAQSGYQTPARSSTGKIHTSVSTSHVERAAAVLPICIDTLTFTFRDEFEMSPGLRQAVGRDGVCLTDEDVIKFQVAPLVLEVFGHPITGKRPGGGLNFYLQTYLIGDPALQQDYGHVSIGGQRDTICVHLTGLGLTFAAKGWERRLFRLLAKLPGARLTRVDVAADDLEGAFYSPDKALEDYEAGAFSLGAGRSPHFEQRGNWVRPDGSGRTAYIGRRSSGKLLRVYEKGRQLGNPDDEWVRIELELHNKDREIPFDILLDPGKYLAGSYGCLGWISAAKERIATIAKAAQMTYAAAVGHLRKSYGRLLNVMREMEGSAEAALALVVREGMPGRLSRLSQVQADYAPVLNWGAL